MENEVVYLGTHVKLEVRIEPIGPYHMSDYDFECEFYCSPNKKEVKRKNVMIEKNQDAYLTVLDTESVGVGELKCRIITHIPDGDCPNGLRDVVKFINTKIPIIA